MSNNMSEIARWYVVHTYSGYENKVKADIEKTIMNRSLQHLITDLQVPVEDVVEEKDGKKKIIQRKVFPGYVFIKMVMNDDSWYVVRNTRGVTGFVGPGSKPVPLTDDEIISMGIKEEVVMDIDLEVGETIRITAGPFEGFMAIVQEIVFDKQKVKALVDMFGRETKIEIDFNQLTRLD